MFSKSSLKQKLDYLYFNGYKNNTGHHPSRTNQDDIDETVPPLTLKDLQPNLFAAADRKIPSSK